MGWSKTKKSTSYQPRRKKVNDMGTSSSPLHVRTTTHDNAGGQGKFGPWGSSAGVHQGTGGRVAIERAFVRTRTFHMDRRGTRSVKPAAEMLSPNAVLFYIIGFFCCCCENPGDYGWYGAPDVYSAASMVFGPSASEPLGGGGKYMYSGARYGGNSSPRQCRCTMG